MLIDYRTFSVLYPTLAEFAKEKGWRCGKSFISWRSKCYKNPKTGKIAYKYEINPKTGRKRKVKVGLSYKEYQKARSKAIKKKGKGSRLTEIERRYIADTERLAISTKKKKQRAQDAKRARTEKREGFAQFTAAVKLGEEFSKKHGLEKAIALKSDYEKRKIEHYANEQRRINKIEEERAKLLREANTLDNKAVELARAKKFDESDSLFERSEEIVKKAKVLGEQQKKRAFDRYDDLTQQINSLDSDRFIERTSKSEAEVKARKKERNSKKAALHRSKEAEALKLPGVREFNNVLKELKQNSKVTKTDSRESFEDSFYIQEREYKGFTDYQKIPKKIASQIKSDSQELLTIASYKPSIMIAVQREKGKNRAFARPDFDLGQSSKSFTKGEVKPIRAEINIGSSYDSQSDSSTIRARKRGKTTLFHELGHVIEYENFEIRQANKAWIESRASGKPQSLNSLGKTENYESWEVAYPDNFINPYVGKVYEKGTTEVMSMGIEHFSTPQSMLKLYEGDREHFYLTLGHLLKLRNAN